MFRKSLLIVITGLSLSAFVQAAEPAQTPASDSPPDNAFVLVPFPCPSDSAYKKAQEFMDQICLHATQDHYKVVIVRSCYNESANLKKSRDDNWWWDEIQDLPKRYAVFIDQGTVTIVDDAKLEVAYTPEGFFYRKGKLIWTGQLNALDPDGVLDMFSQN